MKLAALLVGVAVPAQLTVPDDAFAPPPGATVCSIERRVCLVRLEDAIAARTQIELALQVIRRQEELIDAQKRELDRNVKKCAELIPERRT